MSLHLTRLAVENREILAVIAAGDVPSTVDAFARAQDRDPSNFRKTLRALEGEGWIVVNQPGSDRAAVAADAAHRALLAMDVAAGAAVAGLPPLVHAQIAPDPDQPRRDFDEVALAELAESIASRNLKQPILVRMVADGSAMIVAGERRWRAIGRLIAARDPRWPADRPVPYALEAEKDAGEILATQVVENVQRQGLHPLEEGEAFKRLKDDHGWGVGKISEAIGRTRRFVEQRLDLLNLTPAMQARMRLPKDDDNHLTVPRAREILAHLRQVTAGAGAQRDVEELAPAGFTPEEIEAARKLKLDARSLLALGEIAAAIEAAPSTRFPHSPTPVVDVDRDRAIHSDPLTKLTLGKLAELLIDGDAEGRPAGVRMQPLGHVRLRIDQLHPADNARALFHLRREAGLSGDQARELQRLGRWSSNFLNVAPPMAQAPAQPIADVAAMRNRPTIPSIAESAPAGGATITQPWVENFCLTVSQEHALAELAHKILAEPLAMERRVPPILEERALIAGDANQDRDFAILYRNGFITWGACRNGEWFASPSKRAQQYLAQKNWPLGDLSKGYRTPWLNVRSASAATVAEDDETTATALDRAEYFTDAVKSAALAKARAEPGGERTMVAYLCGQTTADGETWPTNPAEVITPPWTDQPRACIRLTVSDRGRWHVCLSTSNPTSGSGDAYGVSMNAPIFRTRADALAHAAERIVAQLGEWGKKRKLQAWLAEIQVAPAEAVAEPLTLAEIQILRAVDHAQAANGAAPVTVGRYWLDHVAVGLWKRSPSPLIEFKAEPGEHWTVRLTPAGGLELAKAGPADGGPAENGEGYAQAWLNGPAEDEHPVADDQVAPEDGADEDDPRNAEILRQVREELARPAPDFGALLQLIGIKGKLEIAGDVAIQAEGQDTDIVIDPWRTLSQPIAQAQAELVVWALNFAAGHIEPPPAAGDDLVDRVLHTGKELCGVLAGKLPPGTPLWFDVGAAYEPFAQARNALDWNRQRAAREAKAAPLLAIDVGTVMHKGTDATAFRILERLEDRPRQYGQQLEPAFRAQTLRHGKDYGDPVVIGLGDLVGFVPAKAAA